MCIFIKFSNPVSQSFLSFQTSCCNIAPYQISTTGSISSAVLTEASLATINNTGLSYPYYAWSGIFRIDYTQRELLGVVEFIINTPTSGGAVGTNGNINIRLLATNTSTSTDGRYVVNRVLRKTGAGTLTQGSIPVQFGWLIGVEHFGAQSEASGTDTVTPVQELSGTNNYSWRAGLVAGSRPFSRSISGYKNSIISLIET